MAGKNVSLTIRLDPEEKMRIKRWAIEAGQSVSEYVMAAVRERLKRDETPPEQLSDLELLEGALTKITGSSSKTESRNIADDKSLMDLIGDYVDKDKT